MIVTTALALASSTVSAGTGCTGLNALNPVCQLGNLGGTVASAGVDAVLNGLSQWVASGAEWLLDQIGNVLVSTTTIDVGASWFRSHYGQMTALAGVVVLPLLVASTLQAVYRQNAGQLLRSFFVQLPLALLLGVVGIQIVVLSLSATDALSNAVAGGAGSDVSALLSGVSKGMVAAVADPTMATFVLLMVGLLVAAAAFVLWLELLVRAAAVYVAVLFLPMALATLVWPSIAHWCRRLVETLAALILSKFVIVATLSLAAGAVASGTAGTGAAGSGFAAVLAGGALLVLSTFVPFAILRLIPMVEAGAVGHLEGARQRGSAAMTRLPRTAASYALGGAFDAHGAQKLLAMAGPPGTGGAAAKAAGGGGGGGTGGESGTPRPEPSWENGGMVPNENGEMIGLPGSREIAIAGMEARRGQPKGRKPLLPAPGGGSLTSGGGVPTGSGVSGGTPPREEEEPPEFVPPIIGRPGPNDRQYVMDRDECGPVIRYVRGTGPQ
jgi:hypothetical protein